MRIRRRWSAVLVAGALSLVTAGCSGENDEGRLVGVAMPTTTLERWVSDAADVEAQFKEFGYGVELRFAEDVVADQVAQVDDLIDSGVSLLVIGAVDGSSLTAPLARAAAAGIPVIAYDRLLVDTPDVAYYATFDNFRVGIMQATSLVDALGVTLDSARPDDGTRVPRIELFAGSPDDNNASVFFAGAMSVLSTYLDRGVLEVGSGESTFEQIATQGWAPEVAEERMTRLLDSHYPGGERPAGVLSPNDGIAGGVRAALSGRGGSTGVALTGQDADLAGVKAVVAGEQTSTVFKETRQLAELTVSMGHALLSGQEPETNDITSYDNGKRIVPAMLLAPQLVTADNVNQVLVEPGIYTAEELR